MKQKLLEFLSEDRPETVMPYITTARVEENSITVKPPDKKPTVVSPPQAGELLAHDVITLLCQETLPMSESPTVPFAWLCLADNGLKNALVGTMLESAETTLASQWGIRTPGRTRSMVFRSILRPNPPAIVILSGEETPTSNDVAHRMAEALTRQQMISPYAASIVRVLNDNPRWLQDERQYNPHALRRLEQLVVRDVSEGNLQAHAVLIFDDEKPQPIEVTVDVALTMTCMSEEIQRHPALQGHRKNLFTVVVEKP